MRNIVKTKRPVSRTVRATAAPPPPCRLVVAMIMLFCLTAWPPAKAFQVLPGRTAHRFALTTTGTTTSSSRRLFYGRDEDSSLDYDVLRERLEEMRVKCLEQEYQNLPNPDITDPEEFVLDFLDHLRNSDDPWPDSGFRTVLRASTKKWRNLLYRSVGAPSTASEEVVASALGQAMERPDNQYAIVVGEAEDFVPTFPSDPLEYPDGTCWLECRFRSKEDNSLLVTTGWNLQKRKSDGAWLVDGIDWHDFRDEFAPGIGQEEWNRICG